MRIHGVTIQVHNSYDFYRFNYNNTLTKSNKKQKEKIPFAVLFNRRHLSFVKMYSSVGKPYHRELLRLPLTKTEQANQNEVRTDVYLW